MSAVTPILVICGGLTAWALVIGVILALVHNVSRARRQAEVAFLMHQAVEAGRVGQADQLAAELAELSGVRHRDEELITEAQHHLTDR